MADYRPTSITTVLSRVIELIIVRDHCCNVRHLDSSLKTSSRFAFLPTVSTTAALIKLIHEVTAMLESNPYVIVCGIDFSKVFTTVRHSELLSKCSKMKLPDCDYYWLIVFRAHTLCSGFGGVESQFISAGIIQSLATGPACCRPGHDVKLHPHRVKSRAWR